MLAFQFWLIFTKKKNSEVQIPISLTIKIWEFQNDEHFKGRVMVFKNSMLNSWVDFLVHVFSLVTSNFWQERNVLDAKTMT